MLWQTQTCRIGSALSMRNEEHGEFITLLGSEEKSRKKVLFKFPFRKVLPGWVHSGELRHLTESPGRGFREAVLPLLSALFYHLPVAAQGEISFSPAMCL